MKNCVQCVFNKCGCFVENQIKIIKLEQMVLSLKRGLALELMLRYSKEGFTPREIRALITNVINKL